MPESEKVVSIVKQELENALSIADLRGDIKVVKSELDGVREQQKSHHTSTQESFKDLGVKIDDLTAVMNKGKGAFAVALMAAGTVGALISKVLGYLFTKTIN
jgi:hypothetical protein